MNSKAIFGYGKTGDLKVSVKKERLKSNREKKRKKKLKNKGETSFFTPDFIRSSCQFEVTVTTLQGNDE